MVRRIFDATMRRMERRESPREKEKTAVIGGAMGCEVKREIKKNRNFPDFFIFLP